MHTKIAVYDAVVISIILYGCEIWVPYHCNIRPLESFDIRRLQLILELRLWNKVTHSEIRSRAGVPSIKSMLLHHQLCWLSHIIRIPDSQLPHHVLCGRLKQGDRSVGGQKKCFKDHFKLFLKKCNIPFNRLEALSSSKATWQSTCACGMSYLMLNIIMLQLSDTCMPHCPAHFHILLTSVHCVAEIAAHVLASPAAMKLTFNDEEEDVVIRTAEEERTCVELVTV